MSGQKLGRMYALYIWAGIVVALLFALALGTGSVLAAPTHGIGTGSDAPLATATPCPGDYTVAQSAGSVIVPGTTLVPGTQCDECVHSVTLPFAYTLYNRSFNSFTVTANGQLVFGTPVDPSYSNQCLPDPYSSYAIFGHWTDLTLDTGYVGCTYCGIFTSVSGSAPNRIFNVEWRAISFDNQLPVNFEIRLYEGQTRFDIVYASLDPTHGFSSLATVGVQRDTGSTYTQVQCPTQPGAISTGLKVTFTLASQCGSTPTPVPPTATATPVTNAYLTGHVTFQGRPAQPSALQQLPVTLNLTSGSVSRNYATTTDANGNFTVDVTGLAPGSYSYRVKGTKQLSNAGTVVLTGAPSLTVEMGLLRAGDANNDNLCNVADYNILKPTFGKNCSNAGYDDRADFTGDCRINVADFLLLKYNFGAGGESPSKP